jgi:hypothetical protein
VSLVQGIFRRFDLFYPNASLETCAGGTKETETIGHVLNVFPPKMARLQCQTLLDRPFSPQEYEASTYHSLEITAQRSKVQTFNWVSPEIAEVMLCDYNTTYFVSPLSQVDQVY